MVLKSLIVCAAALILLGRPTLVHGDVIGQPTVIDGETPEVAGKRFRLYGIDAPDPAQTCEIRGRTYPCGNVSRTALMDLVAGVNIRCVPRMPDAADPPLAICYAAGYDLSEGMVHTGWAMAMPRRGTKYARIEKRAQKARRGLWQGKFLPPWEWRP